MTYHDTDTEAFVMDDLGNRIGNQTLRADGTVNFAVDSTTNRYTSIGGNSITHDDAGNMTGDKDGYVYFYDEACPGASLARENRIVKIEDSSSSTVATFEYDALGRRIRKVDVAAAVTTLYYYAPEGRVWNDLRGLSGRRTSHPPCRFWGRVGEGLGVRKLNWIAVDSR